MVPKNPKERTPPFFLPTEKRTLDIYLHSVRKMRDFMFADLQKGIDAKANFLVAGALNTYTEVWGRLLEGIPEGESRRCYESFFRRLGKCYENLLADGVDVYHEVRCGLVHSYVIGGTAIVNMGTGLCGIDYDSGKYAFNIVTYFADFKNAVDEYISRLKSDMPVQNPRLEGFIGAYAVKNPLHLNLYQALNHKPVVI
jgi:hypothetical protein